MLLHKTDTASQVGVLIPYTHLNNRFLGADGGTLQDIVAQEGEGIFFGRWIAYVC